MYDRIKLGVAPTRRNIFSKEDALLYKQKTYDKLSEMGVNFVTIEGINDEGLLFGEPDVEKAIRTFTEAKIDALFAPHCNFGTEDLVCKVAKAMGVPVLLWGPRDEAPLPDGARLRDSQCGLFATGKILRRFNVPFSYIVNCRLEDKPFSRGVDTFLRAANIAKAMKKLRVLQIGPRPEGFWTVMANEGELLEKFGVQVTPVPLTELWTRMQAILKGKPAALTDTIQNIHDEWDVTVPDADVETIAALKVVIESLAEEKGCQAACIQCWNSLQDVLHIMPCMANSLLYEAGIPCTCETDIHGAISCIIAQAATLGEGRAFFADWTVRHPTNPNGELLQHCGPFPRSVAAPGKRPQLGRPFAFDHHCPGACIFEMKRGDVTMVRFDGDHGEYGLLLGNAKVIDGPFNNGTFGWIEVKDWPALEEKIVTGPYIHHVAGVYGRFVPAIYEACKYIPGLEPDLYDTGELEAIGRWMREE